MFHKSYYSIYNLTKISLLENTQIFLNETFIQAVKNGLEWILKHYNAIVAVANHNVNPPLVLCINVTCDQPQTFSVKGKRNFVHLVYSVVFLFFSLLDIRYFDPFICPTEYICVLKYFRKRRI